ncbi:MAG: polysaccharide deacetylase family protein [Magnetococcales bacterium]|nr:polysaccharide deacetylase family protein [Magnetococcales bacterium]
MAELRFVCSWDDGHPLDRRLGELLTRHGFPAAFYLASQGVEGRPTLAASAIRDLAQGFEIGGHTRSHPDLPRLPLAEARREVVENKAWLEEILGREITGFCYPRGRHAPAVRELVRQAGFRYARTTRPLCLDPGADPWRLPVTVQCHPHSRGVLARQWLKHGDWGKRWGIFRAMAGGSELLDGLTAALESGLRRGGVFHLWGHSWEVEAGGLWSVLETFLARAAEQIPPSHRLAPGDLFPVPAERPGEARGKNPENLRPLVAAADPEGA